MFSRLKQLPTHRRGREQIITTLRPYYFLRSLHLLSGRRRVPNVAEFVAVEKTESIRAPHLITIPNA